MPDKNARVYTTHDPESPDPNHLQIMPTKALIDELIVRFPDCVIVTHYDQTWTYWRRGNEMRSLALLEVGKTTLLKHIP